MNRRLPSLYENIEELRQYPESVINIVDSYYRPELEEYPRNYFQESYLLKPFYEDVKEFIDDEILLSVTEDDIRTFLNGLQPSPHNLIYYQIRDQLSTRFSDDVIATIIGESGNYDFIELIDLSDPMVLENVIRGLVSYNHDLVLNDLLSSLNNDLVVDVLWPTIIEEVVRARDKHSFEILLNHLRDRHDVLFEVDKFIITNGYLTFFQILQRFLRNNGININKYYHD